MILRQALRFGIVGVVNTATYYALYLLLRLVVPYLAAHVVAFGLATVGSFFLNCWFTYRTRPTWRKFVLFPLTVVANFVVTTVGVFVLVEGLAVDERLSPLVAAAAAIPVTFLLSRTILTGRVGNDRRTAADGGGSEGHHPIRRRLRGGADLASAALLSASVYLATLVVRGVAPFGTNSVLTHDLNHQYSSFFAYVRRAVLGPEGLLFTWQADLGMNVLPLVAYYLASPFTVVVLLVDDAHLPEALVVMTAGKLAAAGACMALFLRRVQPGPRPLVVAFSVVYATMAWALFQASNLMWLDALYLLPLVLLAVERLLATGHVLPLGLATAATMLVNYYVGGMVVLFAALYLLARVVATPGSTRLRELVAVGGRAVGAVVVGILTAGVLLAPSLRAVGQRPPVAQTVSADVPLPWSELVARLFGGTMEDALRGSPHLAAGTVTLAFALLFFAARPIPRVERLAFAAVSGVLLLSCQVPALYILWHGLDAPTSYPHRFGFVVSFLLVYLGYRAAATVSGRSAARVLGVAVGVTLLAACWVAFRQPTLMTPDVLVWTVVVLVLGGAAGVAYLLLRHRRDLGRTVGAVLAGVVLADATGAACLASRGLVHVDRAVWDAPGPAWQAAAAAARPGPDEFFRADGLAGRSPNDGLRFGTFALTHYSSLTDGALHVALRRLGFADPVPYIRFTYQGSTLVTDALLGFRYVLSDEPLDRAGYRLVRYAPPGSTPREPPLFMYENDNALPVGIFLRAGPMLADGHDPFAQQEALVGDKDLFTDACADRPVVTGGTLLTRSGSLVVERHPRASTVTVRWDCAVSRPSQVYAWQSGTLTDVAIRVGRGPVLQNASEQGRGVLDLGRRKPGTFTVRLSTSAPRLVLGHLTIQGLDLDRFGRWVDGLASRSQPAVHWSADRLTVHVRDRVGGPFFLAVPYILGWQARIDGEPAPIRRAAGAFMEVALPPGDHRIDLRFRPPGLRLGLAVTAAGLLLLALSGWHDRRLRRARKERRADDRRAPASPYDDQAVVPAAAVR